MTTFLYTDNNTARQAAAAGLKLSEAANASIQVYGDEKPCIMTYLHPNDRLYDISVGRFGSESIIKIDALESKAFIVDAALTGELYTKSAVPINEYRLGMYRQPRCAIICSVFPDNIKLYDGCMDEPILYESSAQLYIDALYGRVLDGDNSFKEFALRAYYAKQADDGILECVSVERGIAYVTRDKDGKGGKTVVASFAGR